MAFNNSAEFCNHIGLAYDGKIRFQTTVSGEPTNGPYESYVSVWVDGEVVFESDETGTGEMTHTNGGTATYDVDIPLNDDGSYRGGTYRLRLRTYDTDSAAFVNLDDVTVEYNPSLLPGKTINDDLDVSISYDCATALIEVVDRSNMEGWNESVVGDWRTITVVPPATVKDTTPTPVTDESADSPEYTWSQSFGYTNAKYNVAIAINRVKSLDQTGVAAFVNVSLRELIGKTETLNIQCGTDTSICQVASCVEEKFTAVDTLACNGGGWGNLSSSQKSDLEYIFVLNTLRQLYIDCDNYNKAGYYQNRISEFVNCGCGCDDTDQPIPYTAPGA